MNPVYHYQNCHISGGEVSQFLGTDLLLQSPEVGDISKWWVVFFLCHDTEFMLEFVLTLYFN